MATTPPTTVHELTGRIHRLRGRDRLSRHLQWLLVFEALAHPYGGLAALRSRAAIVSFVAEPADDACRCNGQAPRSALVAVRSAHMEQLRLIERDAGQRAREYLTGVWALLGELVLDVLPMHLHAGFVIDFGTGILGAWHDWTCLPCSQGLPCLLVDLEASGPLSMARQPAVAGVSVFAQGPPGRDAGLSADPRYRPVRPVGELSRALEERMSQLNVALPCSVMTDEHDENAGAA